MDGGLSLRNSTTMWRWAVLCCVIVGGMFTSVAGASAKGGTNVAGLYEFHAYGITAAEPDRGETLQLVGRFQLAQQIGNVLGGALGDGPCDTGNGQSTMDILGSSSGSSVTFTATALFPLECVLTFTGTLAGETLEGTWKIELFGGSDCGEDEACEGKFKAQRFQKLPTEEEEIEAKEAKEKKEKEEAEKRKKEEEEENADDEEPSVTSVTDQSTGTNSGSILGGDTLTVKGSGFKLSDDEEAEVQFFLGSNMVASSEVTPTSGGEIEVEAPKLGSSAKDVPEGATGLALDVRVQITYENEDGETETVKSPSELNGTGPDSFEALIPKVGSVIDEASDSDQGPIFGGQTLQIDGSGFDVPQGDKATVSFELDGEVLGESVEVTPDSATEIEVKAPDLAKYDSRVAAASRRPAFGGPGVALFDPDLDSTAGDLVLEVFVAVQDAAKDLVSSPAGAGDAYDEDGPYISSVANERTGNKQGSILGGETLKIEGSGFEVPEGGEAKVEFYVGATRVKTVAVQPQSSSLIEFEAPDLSSLQSDIPDGKAALVLSVVVTITDEDGDEVKTKNNDGSNVYEALLPQVASVEDQTTKASSGPLLGHDMLKITGVGFYEPPGYKIEVSFYSGEEKLEEVDAAVGSSTEIEVESPDLAKYASKIPAGESGLKLDLVVAVGDGTSGVMSASAFDGEGADAYDALIPVVTSVTDLQSEKHSGSIFGGNTLKIVGENFNVPAGGKAAVAFVYGGTVVKTLKDVEPVSSTVIEVEAPDLASLAKEIPDGKDGLATDVVVGVGTSEDDQVQSQTEGTGEGPDAYEARRPMITSVTDVQTGKNSGSILGGDTLKIEGENFSVPAGGKAGVAFVHGGIIKTLKVEPVSSTVIEVQAPDLVSLAKGIPDGKDGLALDLVIGMFDGEGNEVQSPTEGTGEGPDSYDALIPVVTSVTDVQTGKSSGSILGGDTLKIEGENFGVPAGAKAAVAFVYGGTYVKTLKDVVPVSSTVIEVEAPDLASLAKEIPDGKDGLATDVVVGIGTSETDQVQSQTEGTGEGPDAYEARRPMITSVTDVQTGKSSGSILGGDTLKIEGENFSVPAGGKAGVAFVHGGIIKTLKVVPVSSTVIEVEAPDLASLAKEIPDGKDGLALDLVIGMFDGEGNEVQSPTEGTGEGPDSYDALIPVVTSVTDVQTGKSSGSILGGDTLKIEGENLGVPAGGKATVGFALPGGGAAEGSQVTPLSSAAIQVTDPNLTAFAKNIGQGQSSLLTDVTVTISDAAQATVSSPVTAADRFSFQVLTITSGEAATFTVGKHGSFAVSAEGAGTVALKESGALPEGVSFVDNGGGSGALVGIPAAGTAGVYQFVIAASNGVEPEVTQNFTMTVKDVPGAPGSVEAVAGVDSAVVSWSAPAFDGQSPIQSYVVTASPGGQSVMVDGSATSATVEGLEAGTAYTFSVAAKNALGTGEAAVSNSVVATSTSIEDPQSATSSTPDGSASTEPVTAADGTTITADADGEGTIEVGTYASDPVAELGDATSFFDVATTPRSSFTSASFKICGVGASSSIKWWNPASESWQLVSSQTAPSGTPTCVTVTVNTTTSPSLAELYGTVFAVLTQPASTETSPGTQTSSTPTTSMPTTPAPSTPTQSAKPASGSVSLVGSEITVASNGRAAVKLTCTGNATCSGEFTLTVEGKASKAKQRHAKAQTIGTASFSIPAGETVAIKLTLNTIGMALLSAAHGHLGATLTIHQSSPAPGDTRTNNIDLVKLPPHTAPHVPGRRSKPDRD